ncbi:flavoprotein [Nocardiopsis sp. N85]|uniref:flavoprotein n=1 Tax=Nocardiopsis sp. N85 TaxID=3029400 RepID=UPI00237FD209|nr:flavoprotein [Nocardiopsis sp. N85]MDE3723106.1 flavoprotein [Nocardiopsis sp. N85]
MNVPPESRGAPAPSADAEPDPTLPLPFSRLLLVVTGSVSAADLPFWGTWLRLYHEDLEVRLVLTPSARRFLTSDAVGGRFGGEVRDDVWPEGDGTAHHVEFAEWADAVLIFPATFDFTARFALGRGDSPALLASQCTTAPIAIAPALPPGGAQSPAHQEHLRVLRSRPNVVVVPPQPGVSITTGRRDAWAPALFPHCLTELSALHERLAAGRAPDTVEGAADAPVGTGRDT